MFLSCFLISCQKQEPDFKYVIQAHGGELAFYHLRDVEMDLTARDFSIPGKSAARHYKERFRFSDERCLSAADCTRAFFLFAFPFKFANPAYTFKFLGPALVQNTSYEKVSACFTAECLEIFINEKKLIAWMHAFDPEFNKKVWINFKYETINGLQIPASREFYQESGAGFVKIREEALKNIYFWNGFTDADFKTSGRTVF